jgi:hypothetical protein
MVYTKRLKCIPYLSCLVLVVLCHSALAQQPQRIYRTGYLSPRSEIGGNEDAFRRRMHELGYVERNSVVIDWRFTKGKTNWRGQIE